MIRRIMLLSLVLLAQFAGADSTPPASAPAPAQAAGAAADNENNGGKTTIVGNLEAPEVSNVLPWQTLSESKLSKEAVTASVLQESLDPLDPDTLRRELEFHKALDGTSE